MAFAAGCGDKQSTTDVIEDIAADTTIADTSDTVAGDVENDTRPDDVTDDTDDAVEDAATDTGPLGLPDSLNVEFVRENAGEPVGQAEIDEFTRSLMRFLRDVGYFNYVLYTTYGRTRVDRDA